MIRAKDITTQCRYCHRSGILCHCAACGQWVCLPCYGDPAAVQCSMCYGVTLGVGAGVGPRGGVPDTGTITFRLTSG